jgi:hypothetical protein
LCPAIMVSLFLNGDSSQILQCRLLALPHQYISILVISISTF